METPDQGSDRARGGNGQYIRTIEGAQRDAEAARLRATGMTYSRIAEELGYAGSGKAHQAVQRALIETMKEPADELRSLQVMQAMEVYQLARVIALKNSPAHSHGKVVYVRDANGSEIPLVDDGPKLSAMDRMLKAMERMAKLQGLDSPTKVENISLEYVQAEIARLEAEAREAGEMP